MVSEARLGPIFDSLPHRSLTRRAIEQLALETSEATVLYWVGVGILVAGLFVPRLLPCVDYPQHLALSDVARRLGDPLAPENAEYRLNYFTYNGLFHVLVAGLSRVLPIELAGRIVVALSVTGMAGGVVALLRVLGRPPIFAALFTPALFSFSLGWGFVNYVLATTLATWALVLVASTVVRPTRSRIAGVAVLGLTCAFAHVLGMLVLCGVASSLAIELSWRTLARSEPASLHLKRVARRALTAVSPLVFGCFYCILVYRRQYAWDPRLYRDPVLEGIGPPIWRKLVRFGAYTLDLFPDGTERMFLWCAIGIMGAVVWLAWKQRRTRAFGPWNSQPILAPFVVLMGAYLATPTVVVGTHLVFQRLGQWAVLSGLLALPSLPFSIPSRLRRWILGLALCSGANVALHCCLYAWETADASRVIDELPTGRSATAVIWDPGTRAFRNGTLTHLAAYYAARKHGRWSFAFARYLSVPVRFRSGTQPAWPAHGWEFSARAYNPRCKYARAFPLVIVKAPRNIAEDANGEAALRQLVFRQDSAAVKLLSHHGRYWAFDTTGLPDDGSS